MEKSWRTRLILAAALCALSVAAMILTLTRGGRTEFTPPPFDPAAQVGIPEVPEGLGWCELDTGAFKLSVCGIIAPRNGAAEIWLTNPESNSVWLKLRVLDTEDNILGETGLIRPGEYLRYVSLNSGIESRPSLKLKLMAYEPETYYSAGAVLFGVDTYY